MFCHLMVYMRIVLATLVSITCLLGDHFVEVTQHPLLKALIDNATHAVIGALTGIAFGMHFYDNTTHLFGWFLTFTCFAVSSLIDLDHFIEARSWSLEDATSLTHRPFLHCSSIIVVLLLLYIIISCLNYFRWSLFVGVLVCAFVTHHTRDAIRRGYWFCPFGSTDRLPYLAYILTTILTPYALAYLHDLCLSSPVQHLLSKYVKYGDNYRKDMGYYYMQV